MVWQSRLVDSTCTGLPSAYIRRPPTGSGIIIARLADGSWSAPSCIGTGGVGVGFQMFVLFFSLVVPRLTTFCDSGADLSEFVVVLNSDEAVRAFARGGNVTIGGNLSASAGPIGTGGSIESALTNPSPLFTYSKSKGLYAGVSLEGTALIERVREIDFCYLFVVLMCSRWRAERREQGLLRRAHTGCRSAKVSA